LTEANRTAERTTVLAIIKGAKPGSTVGGDKDYDTGKFVGARLHTTRLAEQHQPMRLLRTIKR
jgi:hypothetical protein